MNLENIWNHKDEVHMLRCSALLNNENLSENHSFEIFEVEGSVYTRQHVYSWTIDDGRIIVERAPYHLFRRRLVDLID